MWEPLPPPLYPEVPQNGAAVIGNPPRRPATEQDCCFEQNGKVLECDIIKNYSFVHIKTRQQRGAIHDLHHHQLHSVTITAEVSKNKSKASIKLHMGNISPTCTIKGFGPSLRNMVQSSNMTLYKIMPLYAWSGQKMQWRPSGP